MIKECVFCPQTSQCEGPHLSLSDAVSRAVRSAGVLPVTTTNSLQGELERPELQEAYTKQVKCRVYKDVCWINPNPAKKKTSLFLTDKVKCTSWNIISDWLNLTGAPLKPYMHCAWVYIYSFCGAGITRNIHSNNNGQFVITQPQKNNNSSIYSLGNNLLKSIKIENRRKSCVKKIKP